MRSLGADHVIDTARRFTRNGKQYDLILDVIAHGSVFGYKAGAKAQWKYFAAEVLSYSFPDFVLGTLIRRSQAKKLRMLMVRHKI